MRARSPVRRIVLGLLAMVHLSVPTLATAAHSQLVRAHASDAAQAHVGELGQHRSAPAHPESCVFCKVLGRDVLAESEQVAQALGAVRAVPPLALRQDVQSRALTARPGSRAPPAQA